MGCVAGGVVGEVAGGVVGLLLGAVVGASVGAVVGLSVGVACVAPVVPSVPSVDVSVPAVVEGVESLGSAVLLFLQAHRLSSATSTNSMDIAFFIVDPSLLYKVRSSKWNYTSKNADPFVPQGYGITTKCQLQALREVNERDLTV